MHLRIEIFTNLSIDCEMIQLKLGSNSSLQTTLKYPDIYIVAALVISQQKNQMYGQPTDGGACQEWISLFRGTLTPRVAGLNPDLCWLHRSGLGEGMNKCFLSPPWLLLRCYWASRSSHLDLLTGSRNVWHSINVKQSGAILKNDVYECRTLF